MLNGFEITLPTYARNGIEIDLTWFDIFYKVPPKMDNQYEDMRRYFKLLDNREYDWYELAKCRCLFCDEWSKFKMFVWWFGKAKWHKVDRCKWEERFIMENDRNLRKLEVYRENIKNTEKNF